MRKTYHFLELPLAGLHRTEAGLDGLQALLQLLVEAGHLLLALLLQGLLPGHGELLDLLERLVAPLLLLLNIVVEVLAKQDLGSTTTESLVGGCSLPR